MRRLLAIPLLVLLLGAGGQQVVNTGHHRTAPPVSAGLAIVSGATHQCKNSSGSGGNISCTVTGANAGDLLMIYGAMDHDIPPSFTDSAGTPATPVIYGLNSYSAVTVEPNISAGPHTITMSGAVFESSLVLQEYSGAALSSAMGANNGGGNSGNFSPVNCSALTSTQSNSMTFVGIVISGGTASSTLGSLTNSFVQRQSNTTPNVLVTSTADNVATLNGSSGSSISTSQSYTAGSGANSWDCLEVEIKHP
jgi:hypothetical protein